MANRIKRLREEELKRLEDEKFAAALRRSEKSHHTPRIRKRRPERSNALAGLQQRIVDFWDTHQPATLGGHSTAAMLADDLFGSRPLLRALITDPSQLTKLLRLYRLMPPVRPVDSWEPPKSQRPDKVLASFLRHTFVQYQMPRPLLTSFAQDEPERGLYLQFCHIAAGHNFREMPHLPAPVSKKTAHLALHAPDEINWREVPALACLHAMGFPRVQAIIIAQRLDNDFVFNPEHRHFWFFLLQNPGLQFKEILKMLRFYEDQSKPKVAVKHPKYPIVAEIAPLYPGIKFKGTTPAAVRRRMAVWDALVKQVQNSIRVTELPVSKIRPMGHSIGEDKISISQITVPGELLQEGRAMSHCVGTYLDSCLFGHCTIWSVRKNGERLATLELRKEKQIAQIRGKCNTYPGDVVVQLVQKWAKKEGLKLN